MTSHFNVDKFERGTQPLGPTVKRQTGPLTTEDPLWARVREGEDRLRKTVEVTSERFEILYRAADSAQLLGQLLEPMPLRHALSPQFEWVVEHIARVLKTPVPLRRDIILALSRYQAALSLLQELADMQRAPDSPPRDGLIEHIRLHAFQLSTMCETFREEAVLSALFPSMRTTGTTSLGRLPSPEAMEFRRHHLHKWRAHTELLLSRTALWESLFRPLLEIRTPQGIPIASMVRIRNAPSRLLGLRLLRAPEALELMEKGLQGREILQQAFTRSEGLSAEDAIKLLREPHREFGACIAACREHPILRDFLGWPSSAGADAASAAPPEE